MRITSAHSYSTLNFLYAFLIESPFSGLAGFYNFCLISDYMIVNLKRTWSYPYALICYYHVQGRLTTKNRRAIAFEAFDVQ